MLRVVITSIGQNVVMVSVVILNFAALACEFDTQLSFSREKKLKMDKDF